MEKQELKERLKDIDSKLEECIEDVFLTRSIIQDLFQIIEELSDENFVLKELNVKLNDEINILKGEHPNPKPKPKKKKNKNISSKKEKKDAEDEILEKNSETKETKINKIKISEEQICFVDRNTLPEDAEFKGYTNVTVQEIELKPKNILFKKEIFYSKSEKKTYIADLPEGFEGEFGPELKALIINLKHSSNVSEPKIHSLLEDIGILIGKATISRILTQNNEEFHEEKQKIVNAGFNSSSFQQIDDTGSKVNGEKHFTQVICNPLYSAYFTLPNKERLTIIELLNGKEIESYYFDDKAFDLLKTFRISGKIIEKIKNDNYNKELNKKQMESYLDELFPNPEKSKNIRKRIKEAGAISNYQNQTERPVIQVLLSDDAAQYKQITKNHGLCWIHEARHYKKLDPVIPQNIDALKNFQIEYWDYYKELLKYKETPTKQRAEELSIMFDNIFSKVTGYEKLDERIRKTMEKKSGLLTVLDYPELPLHNNDAELGARAQVRKRDVSLQTKTKEGTKASDTFLTIVNTAKKLGINVFKYIRDRISKKYEMPSLADLINEQSIPHVALI